MKHRKTQPGRAASVSRRGLATKVAVVAGGAILILGAIFWASQETGQTPTSGPGQSAGQTGGTGRYVYQIGSPGPGEEAPPIRLAATTGETFDLASLRGKFVLLFFQEGITCQPCWDQLKDIESKFQQFRVMGIDTVATITTDPMSALKEMAITYRLSSPVLSDPDLAVTRSYDTNSYGMMGKSRNGHTFILVDGDGRIRWRADYGGAPNYTMYVPVKTVIEDMLQGLQKIAAGQ